MAMIENQLDSMTPAVWGRKLIVKLTSKKHPDRVMTFGDDSSVLDLPIQYEESLTAADAAKYRISITGSKHLATSEDGGTIVISNLSTETVLEMIRDEYYILEVYAGYGDNIKRHVKGEVMYITQKITTRRDQDTYIHFASTLVARFAQKRMNFSISSGINMYNALAMLGDLYGLHGNTKVSNDLKQMYLKDMLNDCTTLPSALNALQNCSEGSFQFNTDESIDGTVIACNTIADKRMFEMSDAQIMVSGGNPTVTADGLRMTILPTIVFIPGDILHLESSNAKVDTSVTQQGQVLSTFNQNFLDRNGKYMIYEINYTFENRGDAFEYEIRARALDTYIEQLGGTR